MTSFAVNTEPMKFICVFLSASPIPPLVIPDARHFTRLTSPIPTRSVSCFTDSAVDREFAAPLKDTDKLDSFRITLGAERERFLRLENKFRRLRELLEMTMRNLEMKVIDNTILERNTNVPKAILTDLRQDIDIEDLETDRS